MKPATHEAVVSPPYRLPPRVDQDSTRQALAWQSQPLTFLSDCARRYGDAFTLNLGSYGTYAMFSTPDAIRTIFNASNELLHAGQGNRVLKPLLGARSLLLLEERRHIHERRMLLPAFHAQAIERYGDVIQRVTLQVISNATIGLSADQEVAMQPLMQAISVRVILQAVFGIEEGPRGAALSELIQLVLNDSRLTLGLIDQLQSGSPSGQGFVRSLRELDAMLLREVQLRRVEGANEPPDLLDTLLAARYEDGSALEEQALRDELMTLIVTGYETTATALSWAMYWLARNPAALECARQELTPLGLHAAPAQLAQARYLHAVCQETLRIHPVIPVVAREVQAPFIIQDYVLPAGVTIAISIYLAHHRPDVFADPETFRPERFLENPPSPFEYLPFGGGVRRCIGMSLALFEMKIVLGSILANYQVAPLEHSLRPVRRFVTLAPEGGARLRLTKL